MRSLEQQDRLIGVITHIRALAEQLTTQVKVQKSPEGSRLVVEDFVKRKESVSPKVTEPLPEPDF